LRVLGQEEPDLVMLCGDLSDVDLWSAIKRVRESSDIPVMVAVEGHGELDVVKALELGG
jgi:DNA-binding response OmpR family regulator